MGQNFSANVSRPEIFNCYNYGLYFPPLFTYSYAFHSLILFLTALVLFTINFFILVVACISYKKKYSDSINNHTQYETLILNASNRKTNLRRGNKMNDSQRISENRGHCRMITTITSTIDFINKLKGFLPEDFSKLSIIMAYSGPNLPCNCFGHFYNHYFLMNKILNIKNPTRATCNIYEYAPGKFSLARLSFIDGEVQRNKAIIDSFLKDRIQFNKTIVTFAGITYTTPEKIKERFKKRKGEREYLETWNNCEHLVYYLANGTKMSLFKPIGSQLH